MELEKHHVAAYFPHGLEGYAMGECLEGTEYDDKPIPKLFTVHAIFADNQLSVIYDGKKQITDLSDFFPHLRPIEDLFKVIEIDGKRFVPAKQIEVIKYYAFATTSKIDPINLPYNVVQQLLEWKFDIYRLIPEKLAYDINTLGK